MTGEDLAELVGVMDRLDQINVRMCRLCVVCLRSVAARACVQFVLASRTGTHAQVGLEMEPVNYAVCNALSNTHVRG